jgi:tRNA(Ile2) C34 agmatinyltransferase TiaS
VNEPLRRDQILPGYKAMQIAVCPECLGDCTDEGRDGWWCPACQVRWATQQIGYFEEGTPDD